MSRVQELKTDPDAAHEVRGDGDIKENQKEGETVSDTEKTWNFYVWTEPVFSYLPNHHQQRQLLSKYINSFVFCYLNYACSVFYSNQHESETSIFALKFLPLSYSPLVASGVVRGRGRGGVTWSIVKWEMGRNVMWWKTKRPHLLLTFLFFYFLSMNDLI